MILSKIRPTGNSIAITISPEILKQLNVGVGDYIQFINIDNRIVISPIH